MLFCCVAEMCLRRRRDRLRDAEIACEDAKKAEKEIGHLLTSDFSDFEENFTAERSSIEHSDLFGSLLGDNADIEDINSDNPFARFLTYLANETAGIAEFYEYGWSGWPEYRVCMQEAEELANGDAELVEDIFRDVSL